MTESERIAKLEERVEAECRIRETEREADQRALATALTAAKELAEKHNDLIRQAQDRDQEYARKIDVQRIESALLQVRDDILRERGRFLEVERYDERHEELKERVNLVDQRLGTRIGTTENRLSVIEGGSQLKSSALGWAIAGLGVFIAIVVVVVNVLTGTG